MASGSSGMGSTAKTVSFQLMVPIKLKDASVIKTMSIAAIKPMPNSILTALRSLVA